MKDVIKMKTKINNKTKQNESSKKNLKIIIINYTIFAISVFVLSNLKIYNVISPNFSLVPFYWIVGIIPFISIIVLCCKMNKEYAIKNAISIISVNLFGIIFLIIYGLIIESTSSLIDFSKNTTKIDALVYKDIEKNITKHTKYKCVGIEIGNYCYLGEYKSYSQDYDYYKLEYIYPLQYVADDEVYTSTYSEKVNKEFSSELEANKSYQARYQAKYSKGDYITIYYDNDDPNKFRLDYSKGYGKGRYVIDSLIILFQVFYFIKHKKYMREVTK